MSQFSGGVDRGGLKYEIVSTYDPSGVQAFRQDQKAMLGEAAATQAALSSLRGKGVDKKTDVEAGYDRINKSLEAAYKRALQLDMKAAQDEAAGIQQRVAKQKAAYDELYSSRLRQTRSSNASLLEENEAARSRELASLKANITQRLRAQEELKEDIAAQARESNTSIFEENETARERELEALKADISRRLSAQVVADEEQLAQLRATSEEYEAIQEELDAGRAAQARATNASIFEENEAARERELAHLKAGISARLKAEVKADEERLAEAERTSQELEAVRERDLAALKANITRRLSAQVTAENRVLNVTGDPAKIAATSEAVSRLGVNLTDKQAVQLGLASALPAVEETTEKVSKLAGVVDFARGSLNRFGGILAAFLSFAAFAALRTGVQDLTAFVEEYVKYNAEIEKSQIGIASVLAAVSNVSDETGKAVGAARAFALANTEAAKQARLLREESLQTTVTYQALANVFQQNIGPGLTSGLTVEQIRSFTVGFAQAAASLGVAENQMAAEARQILSGNIQARTNRVAVALGITGPDVRQQREDGTLGDYLQSRFSTFRQSGIEATKTLEGELNQLKNAIDQIIGQGGEGVFNLMKSTLGEIRDYVIQIDEVTGHVTLNPELVRTSKQFGDDLKVAAEYAKSILGSLNSDDLRTVLKYAGSVVIGSVGLAAGGVKAADKTLNGADYAANRILDVGRLFGGPRENPDIVTPQASAGTEAKLQRNLEIIRSIQDSVPHLTSASDALDAISSKITKLEDSTHKLQDQAGLQGLVDGWGIIDGLTQKQIEHMSQMKTEQDDLLKGVKEELVQTKDDLNTAMEKKLDTQAKFNALSAQEKVDVSYMVALLQTRYSLERNIDSLKRTGAPQSFIDMSQSSLGSVNDRISNIGENRSLLGSKFSPTELAKLVGLSRDMFGIDGDILSVQSKIHSLDLSRLDILNRTTYELSIQLDLAAKQAVIRASLEKDQIVSRTSAAANNLSYARGQLGGDNTSQQTYEMVAAQNSMFDLQRQLKREIDSSYADGQAIAFQANSLTKGMQLNQKQQDALASQSDPDSQKKLVDLRRQYADIDQTITDLAQQREAIEGNSQEKQQALLYEIQLAQLKRDQVANEIRYPIGTGIQEGAANFSRNVPTYSATVSSATSKFFEDMSNGFTGAIVDALSGKKVNLRALAANIFKDVGTTLLKGVVDNLIVKPLADLFTNLMSSLLPGLFPSSSTIAAGATVAASITTAGTSVSAAIVAAGAEAAASISAAAGLGGIAGAAGGAAGAAGAVAAIPDGALGGFARGGRIGFARAKGYASGGRPSGLDPTDTIPIWAAVGEWVIKARSVAKYGHSVMHQINEGMIDPSAMQALASASSSSPISLPRSGFSSGGSTAAASGASSHAVATAVIAPTNESMDRLLRGGKTAFFRFLQENAHLLRGITA